MKEIGQGHDDDAVLIKNRIRCIAKFKTIQSKLIGNYFLYKFFETPKISSSSLLDRLPRIYNISKNTSTNVKEF